MHNISNTASLEGSADKQHKMHQDETVPLQVVEEIFTLSAELMSKSKAAVTNETKLTLYGLYKQATQGDCKTSKPGIFDLVGRAKWNSWNQHQGVPTQKAKQLYIFTVNSADSSISEQIEKLLTGSQPQNEDNICSTEGQSGMTGLKKVEQIDYSDEYSHPYFRSILKGLEIEKVEHDLLLVKNDIPAVYALHFAIEQERSDLVQKFLSVLSTEEIESMTDEEGTGIMEYAELMENEVILELVKQKLSNKS